MTNGNARAESVELWQLTSPGAAALAAEAARFEDLQTVLRCCERLLPELARVRAGAGEADVLIESLWTVALLSYARCFSSDAEGTCLVEEDVVEAHSNNEQVREWHRALMRLRKHYASPSVNPREAFSASVARGSDGAPAGIAITSATQPDLDEVTVRSAGTIAFALSAVVDARIASRQEKLFAEAQSMAPADLDKLVRWEAARPEGQEPPPTE